MTESETYTARTPHGEAQNGLAIAGFVLSLLGVFSAGILCPIGLIISLVALGKPGQRGLAIAGAIIGGLGTLFWLLIILLFGVAILAFLGFAFLAVSGPEKSEITADFLAITYHAKRFEQDHGYLPAQLSDLDLPQNRRLDPWGHEYHLSVVPGTDLGFEILSAGPDGDVSTDDDVRFTRLGDLWSDAIQIHVEEKDGEERTIMNIGGRTIRIESSRSGEDVEVDLDGRSVPVDRAVDELFDENR
ncbi:MAG: type II secretion system protein GspG [Planctomycetota bacterium]